jgi:glucose/arabinose dehydrogenase
MFVVEKIGRIVVITDRDTPEPQTFLNLGLKVYNFSESGLLSLAFHPDYNENGRLFIYYVAQEWNGTGFDYFNRLSELSVDPTNPNAALPESEKILINQPDRHSDHNGGGMLFGPDGYLYLTIGDEGEFYDILGNGQKLDQNLFAGMLRIDVDKRPGNPAPNPHIASSDHYAIPSDNPYIGLKEFQGIELDPEKVRTEFYAIGMRNPWRFSFDPLTGKLYSGDTGDHTREEINEIFLGGNYGWPKREGSLPGPPRHATYDVNHGFEDPIAEYGREDGNDVAGMLFYRGTQFPELDGSILFSDYFGGWLGRAVLPDDRPPHIEWLAWDAHIADIAVDPVDGRILMADMSEGRIKFLIPPSATNLSDLPPTLADTGAFIDVKNFVLHPSWIPYEINVPFWSDHAIKSRWISLPGSSRAMRYKEDEAWAFPGGTIFMKHFDMEMREEIHLPRNDSKHGFLFIRLWEVITASLTAGMKLRITPS